jgi:hypothetical protein
VTPHRFERHDGVGENHPQHGGSGLESAAATQDAADGST